MLLEKVGPRTFSEKTDTICEILVTEPYNSISEKKIYLFHNCVSLQSCGVFSQKYQGVYLPVVPSYDSLTGQHYPW